MGKAFGVDKAREMHGMIELRHVEAKLSSRHPCMVASTEFHIILYSFVLQNWVDFFFEIRIK